MKAYLEVANDNIFFICGGVMISFILVQAIIFLRLAYVEGLKLGIDRAKMIKAFRTGALTTIVPTIAVIVALITMIPVLGIPIPWIRLSIIGSAPYELMAAGIGAKVMGVNNLGGAGYTEQVFASSIWVMCVGSIWSVSMVAFFLKTIKRKYAQKASTDPVWRGILMNAAFLGVFCIFIADPVVKGGIALATLLSGAGIMTILALVIVKFKVSWLKEFALAFSMIGAMICTVLITQWLI